MIRRRFFLLLTFFTLMIEYGQGEFLRRTYSLSMPFSQIQVDGLFDVYLQRIDDNLSPSIDIETLENVHDKVMMDMIKDNLLRIRVKGLVTLPKNIQILIRYNQPLTSFVVSGVSKVISTNEPIFTSNEFHLDVRGSSEVSMQVNVSSLNIFATGTSSIRLVGQAEDRAIYQALGSSSIDAWNLFTRFVTVQVSGTSTIQFTAIDDAWINADGVSTVLYRLPTGRRPSRIFTLGLARVTQLN